MIRFAQALGIHDQHRQMLHIWRQLKIYHPHYACRIPRPSQDTSLSEFMRKLYVAEQGVQFGSDNYVGDALEDDESDYISDDYNFDDTVEFDDSD
ncbi:hypothetical protein N7488_005253 [Penicillium malachiteum]|nr:hypothetical protein N7488_005253 [Penicillium malachiteum]